MNLWNTCSAHWANEDKRYKGPHTCHLIPEHASVEHECACGARSAVRSSVKI